MTKKTVKLTEKGNNFALDIIRKHRVWEVFLFEKLGYEKEDVHKEAEILEHVTSDKLLQKLEKFLFYPKECPHGSPIFYDLENLDEENIIKLSEAEEDDEIVILSVEDNIELYDYLRDLDINLKEKYIVERKDPFNGPIYLKSEQNNEKIVAFNAADMIEVYKKIKIWRRQIMSKNNVLTKLNLVIAVCVAMMLLISCGKGGATSGKKIKVTTTTTMLSDLVKTIGGDKVEVTGLMGEGVDPHLYSASAGDIEKLGNADIIVYGGLHLEGKMTEIFEKLTSQNKNILNVGDKLDKSKIHLVDQNTPDPHVWFNTELWEKEAEAVEAELSKFDPKNSDYYKENLKKYKAELNELTTYVKTRINEIPEKSRVLVTAHDAFNYFGEQFGLQVKAIQGVSTDSETGTKNISDLANFIVQRNIKAIFVESSVPKKV